MNLKNLRITLIVLGVLAALIVSINAGRKKWNRLHKTFVPEATATFWCPPNSQVFTDKDEWKQKFSGCIVIAELSPDKYKETFDNEENLILVLPGYVQYGVVVGKFGIQTIANHSNEKDGGYNFESKGNGISGLEKFQYLGDNRVSWKFGAPSFAALLVFSIGASIKYLVMSLIFLIATGAFFALLYSVITLPQYKRRLEKIKIEAKKDG